ncbi:hypothetical protein NVV94_13380 [Pseudomonas sp. LS1212]|uniref:hypothetical protein n=1 Tax=Pseudomonas sp. LS1212 TaxID=2972478 RepID=UPI00215C5930|nr:hypothetical protein [Pseudomonas sp. LS1212]UVJ46702.1 hypothetical protein NVV94_13380 [Pseudomonas sp. LS1212]
MNSRTRIAFLPSVHCLQAAQAHQAETAALQEQLQQAVAEQAALLDAQAQQAQALEHALDDVSLSVVGAIKQSR